MSVEARYRVVCDVQEEGCLEEMDEAFWWKRFAIREARAAGWKPYRLSNGSRGDCCPECWPKFKARRKAQP